MRLARVKEAPRFTDLQDGQVVEVLGEIPALGLRVRGTGKEDTVWYICAEVVEEVR